MIPKISTFGDLSEVALSAHIVSLNPDAKQDVCDTTQTEQEFQGFSANTANAPCLSCYCSRTNLVQMPKHCHFAAIRCGQCDTFLRWQAKPKNIEARQRRQTTISRMLKSPKLSQWERTFLEGLKNKKISPKQQEVLTRIEAKVEVSI